MSLPKHLGITLLLGSLLAACASAPKKPAAEEVTPVTAENDELVQMAKERAAQGGVKAREDSKEKITAAVDTSLEPELPTATEEQKKLAAPVMSDYQQALALLKAQKYDEAYAQFEQIQTKVPMFSGPVLNQALIRLQQKNYPDVELLLKKAMGINEKNPYLYNLQGYTLRQQGKFADAKAAYEKALAISPKYAKAHYNLGVLADLYLQDLPVALQHYEAYQALQHKPDTTVAKWVVDLQKRTGVYKAPAKPVKTEDVTVEETPAADATTPPASEGQAPTTASEGIPPATDTSAPANNTAPTTPAASNDNTAVTPAATESSATVTPITPSSPTTDEKKAKSTKKAKKGAKNVSPSTAPSTPEAVESTHSTPTTTAAGVQP